MPWFFAGPKDPQSSPAAPSDGMTLEVHEEVVASLESFGKDGVPTDGDREVAEKKRLLARLRQETEEKKRRLAELEREQSAAQQRIAELEAELEHAKKP